MSVTSIFHKPILDKLIVLMDAWTDDDSDKVFTVGKKSKDFPFRSRFTNPRQVVPRGHFPCYFYFVTSTDVNWSTFPRNILGNVNVRVAFYKQVWDKIKTDQTHDLYYWAEQLAILVSTNQRWDGAASNGVQTSRVNDIRFDFTAEGGGLFMLADVEITHMVKIDMTV